VYGYFRNDRFNAANALSHTALPLTQTQYGASLGGPVIHDRTFYFANFEQRELNQSGLITIAPANVAAINAHLAVTGYHMGYPGQAIYTGLYPNPVHNTNFLAKIDHQFSERDQFSARYSLYDVHSPNSRGAGGLNAASASAGLDNTDQTIAAGNIATLSPRLVNETRAQFTHSILNAPPSDPIGPAVSISGVASFGTLSGSPTARFNNLYEIADNLSTRRGRMRSVQEPTSSTTTTRSLFRDRFAAAIRFRRSRIFLRGHTTTRVIRRRSIASGSRRPILTLVSTRRTSGNSTRG
jgi:hypothetical protein